jgi:hypothetical protein
MNFFRRNFCLLLFVPLLCLAAQEGPNHQHVGRVLDWSYRHLVVSGGLSPANLEAAKTEPRILFHLAAPNFHREAPSSGQAGYGPENDLSARGQPVRDSEKAASEERLERFPGCRQCRSQQFSRKVQFRHQCQPRLP